MKRSLIRIKIYLILTMTLISHSCDNNLDQINITSGDGEINFYIRTNSASQITRATSTEYEEGRIYNVYILMFRFPNGYNLSGDNKYDTENSVVQRWILADEQIGLDQNGYNFSTNVDFNETGVTSENTRYSFFVIANYGSFNSVMDISENTLNDINSWQDLEAIQTSMQDGVNTIERGTNFLMRGSVDDITKNDLRATEKIVTVNLERIDAKFWFKFLFTDRFVTDGSSPTADKPRSLIKMNPLWWRLHNVPREVNLLSGTKYISKSDPGNFISEDEDNYFITEKFNFEGIGNLFAKEFSFYTLAHSYEPQQSIKELFQGGYNANSSALSDFKDLDNNNDGLLDQFDSPAIPVWQHQWLNLREKREKIPNAGNPNIPDQYQDYFSDGDFIYAPPKAPFIEFEIELIYDLYDGTDSEGNTLTTRYNTNIKVILHLGPTERTTNYPTTTIDGDPIPNPFDIDGGTTMDPDNYTITPNFEYTYNIYFDGASAIFQEATSGPQSPDSDNIENIPGYSGDLYLPNNYKLLNSGANVINYPFPRVLVNYDYEWALTTPFSSNTMADLYNGNTTVNGSMDNIDHKWVIFAINPTNYSFGNPVFYKRTFMGEREHKPQNWFFYSEQTGEIDDDAGFIELENGEPKYDQQNRYIPNAKYFEFIEDHLSYTMGTGEPTGYININQLAQLILLNSHDDGSGNSLNRAYPLCIKASTDNPNSDIVPVTAFVDEYYYHEHPLGGTPTTTQDGLWAQFINRAANRSFSVVTQPMISADLGSSMVASGSVIEQETIQSYYNLDKAGLIETSTPDFPFREGVYFPSETKFICYGLEGLPDTGDYSANESNNDNSIEKEYNGRYVPDSGSPTFTIPNSLANLTSNYRSGLKNTQAWWLYDGDQTLSISTRWDKYIETSDWTLKDEYADYGIYQCLLRNRDEDGDGIIDIEEIKWYMPTTSQIGYMWVGAGALSNSSQLFRNRDYSYDLKFMLSSTVSANLSQIIWLNEGASIGYINDNWGTVNGQVNGPNGSAYIRCFRNLGTPKEYENINYSTVPNMLDSEHEFTKAVIATEKTLTSSQSGYNYISSAWELNLQNIDSEAYRRYTQENDLPYHHISEDHNRPWEAFEVVNVSSSNSSNFVNRPAFTQIANLADTDPDNNPCPKGWRLPNQREAVIMMLMLPFNGYNSGWGPTSSDGAWKPTITYVRQATTPGGEQDGAYNARMVLINTSSRVGDFVRIMLGDTSGNSTTSTAYPSRARCVRDVTL